MSDFFIGQICTFPYAFAPHGWLECNGQQVSIQMYPALYSILGDTFGPHTATTFYLPNLQVAAAAGVGQGPGLSNCTLGERQGAATVAINLAQTPRHSHTLNTETMPFAKGSADFSNVPTANTSYTARYFNTSTTPTETFSTYHPAPVSTDATNATNPVFMSQNALSVFIGGGQPHENHQPYLSLRYCICSTEGYFPARP